MSSLTLNSLQSDVSDLEDTDEVVDCSRETKIVFWIECGFVKQLYSHQQLLGFSTLYIMFINPVNTASNQLQRGTNNEPCSYCEKSTAFHDAR